MQLNATQPAPFSSAPSLTPRFMILQWFLSKTVRQATAMRKHVQKLLNHQRDILSPQGDRGGRGRHGQLPETPSPRTPTRRPWRSRWRTLEKAANKWLKPYPNAAWRENVEVLLVALAVAMGIRTFFLQPFKIPTGSMQPTLYGVTSNPDFKAVPEIPEDLRPNPDFQIPNRLQCLWQYLEPGDQLPAGHRQVRRSAGRLGTTPAFPHLHTVAEVQNRE